MTQHEAKPKLIFHIGMGKTGTTSIQRALEVSTEVLEDQCAEYLGMWLDFDDRSFVGTAAMREFFASPEAEIAARASSLAARLHSRQRELGTETFVYSNEQFFGNFPSARHFVAELRRKMCVEILCVARHPFDWLFSAYLQWGVVNKTYSGPIKTLAEFSKEMIERYDVIADWESAFGKCFQLLWLDETKDVLTLFSEATGLQLESTPDRANRKLRSEDALFRAFFNDAFERPVRAAEFERVAGAASVRTVGRLECLREGFFDFDSLDAVIAAKQSTWDDLREKYGIEIGAKRHPVAAVSNDTLVKAFVEKLCAIVFEQGLRIAALEETVAHSHAADSES